MNKTIANNSGSMAGTMKIERIWIKRAGKMTRLCSDVSWNNRRRTLWFEVDSEFEDYLCYERADGFLVSLLPFAIINNFNIEVNGYVSERLLYQLKTYLLPVLSVNIPGFHNIDINADIDNTVLKSQNAVGTGLSCGIDSFYTVLKHLDSSYENYNLTHVTFFNSMNSPHWKNFGEESSRDFINARISYISPVAKSLGLKLVTVDTNFDLFYKNMGLLETVTFRYCGIVLALQKLFKTYYWSSSTSISNFKLSTVIPLFELFSLQCISNQNTTFYSTGGETTRLEKTKYLSDFEITYKYLNVCWLHLYNCSKCNKCHRTMMSLYSIGKLDLYNKVFDLDFFYKHINEYIGRMIYTTNPKILHNEEYIEIFNSYKGNELKVTRAARLHSKRIELSQLKDRIISIINK